TGLPAQPAILKTSAPDWSSGSSLMAHAEKAMDGGYEAAARSPLPFSFACASGTFGSFCGSFCRSFCKVFKEGFGPLGAQSARPGIAKERGGGKERGCSMGRNVRHPLAPEAPRDRKSPHKNGHEQPCELLQGRRQGPEAVTSPLAKESKWHEDKLAAPFTTPLRILLFTVLIDILLDPVEAAVSTEENIKELSEAQPITRTAGRVFVGPFLVSARRSIGGVVDEAANLDSWLRALVNCTVWKHLGGIFQNHPSSPAADDLTATAMPLHLSVFRVSQLQRLEDRLDFAGRAEFVFWPFPGSFFGFTVLGDAEAAEWLRDQREGSTVEVQVFNNPDLGAGGSLRGHTKSNPACLQGYTPRCREPLMAAPPDGTGRPSRDPRDAPAEAVFCTSGFRSKQRKLAWLAALQSRDTTGIQTVPVAQNL
ncbi:unnamed protein product, partial [Symbiodinium necroappetens]